MATTSTTSQVQPPPGAAADHCPDGLVIVDDQERIVYANQAYAELLGREVAWLAGRDAHQFLTDEDRDHARLSMAFVRAHPQSAQPAPYSVLRPDGSTVAIEALGAPYGDDGRHWIISVRRRPQRHAREQALMAIARSAPLSDVSRFVIEEAASRWPRCAIRLEMAPEASPGPRSGVLPAEVHRSEAGFTDGERTVGWLIVESDSPETHVLVQAGLADLARILTISCTQSRLADELERLSVTDALTGLLNRRGLPQRYAQFASGESHEVIVIVCDVDGLKTINDTRGHVAGDRALVEGARRLERYLPADAAIARIGGDEFAAAFRADVPAGPVTTELADVLSGPDPADPAMVSLSVGIVRVASDTSLEDALHQADLDLYLRRGRARASLDG